MAHVQPPAAEVWHSLSSFPAQAAAKHINIVYLVSYGYGILRCCCSSLLFVDLCSKIAPTERFLERNRQ